MLNRKQLRQKVRLRLFGYPGVLIPFVGGSGAFMAATLMQQPGIPAFVGALLWAATAGVVGWRMLFKMEDISKKALKEIEEQIEKDAQAKLDGLRDRLAEDNDTRDEHMLDDLRNLIKGFQRDRSWMQKLDAVTFSNFVVVAGNLFEGCIQLLEQSVEMRDMASGLRTQAATGLIQSREDLLSQVQEGIDKLSSILEGVQKHSVKKMTNEVETDANVENHARELQRLLEVAERTEQEINTGYVRKYDRSGQRLNPSNSGQP